LAEWLAEELGPVELRVERLRDDLLARFRAERIEPSGSSRVERILAPAERCSSAASPAQSCSAYRPARSRGSRS